jgi:hypothetical protein
MRRTGNRLIAAVTAALAAATATVGTASHAAAAGDVDLVIMGGVFGAMFPPLTGIGPSSALYTVGANCALMVAGTQVPTFVDVPPDELGQCGSVSGSGSFNSLSCATGTTVGNMTITEPSGDKVTLAYTMVFVGGVGVVTGTWSDDSSSGPAVGAARIAPNSPLDCTGVITQYSFTALIAAEY